MTATHAETVLAVLTEIGPTAVAVSGGIDSVTLAHLAHTALGSEAEMFHARSDAVPREATERVRRHADRAGWSLRVIDAGETADERYVANPVDRCYFCKTNLYDTIAAATTRSIVSGTNVDDLGDYRPGLAAAAERNVRHPYVEAVIDKDTVRSIAAHLGLDDLADLPAAPCLSSRIETGIQITPKRLGVVDEVERHLRNRIDARDLRCRIRSTGVVIEVDAHLVDTVRDQLGPALRSLLVELRAPADLRFEPYRRGTAFLRDGAPSCIGRDGSDGPT